MRYFIILGLVLFGIWLLWSGHYQPLTISLGAASCVLVVIIGARMGLFRDARGLVGLSVRAVLYGPWLGWEILKANLDVARLIIDPRMSINPTVIKVKAGQSTAIGRVFYANSITLTPGTVTIDTDGPDLTVHALTREAAESLETGEMDRRVARLDEGI